MDTTNEGYLEDLDSFGTVLPDIAEEGEDKFCLLPPTLRNVMMAAGALTEAQILPDDFTF